MALKNMLRKGGSVSRRTGKQWPVTRPSKRRTRKVMRKPGATA